MCRWRLREAISGYKCRVDGWGYRCSPDFSPRGGRSVLRPSTQGACALIAQGHPGARVQLYSAAMLQIGQIRLSLDMRTAHVGDEEIDLTPKEFELLAMFVQHPGRAFSRDYLLERIWGDDVYVTDRTVDTHVQRLRKKLGDQADLIRTVWGIGYKLQRES